MKYALVVTLTITFGHTSGQRIVAIDTLTGEIRHIKPGGILVVSTAKERMGKKEVFAYSLPESPEISIWSPDGVWKLESLDTMKRQLTINYSDRNVSKSFSFDEVKYLTYVRAKHPWKLRNYRIHATLVGLGLLGLGASGMNHEDVSRPLAVSLLAGGGGLIVSAIVLKGRGKPRGYWFKNVIK